MPSSKLYNQCEVATKTSDIFVFRFDSCQWLLTSVPLRRGQAPWTSAFDSFGLNFDFKFGEIFFVSRNRIQLEWCDSKSCAQSNRDNKNTKGGIIEWGYCSVTDRMPIRMLGASALPWCLLDRQSWALPMPKNFPRALTTWFEARVSEWFLRSGKFCFVRLLACGSHARMPSAFLFRKHKLRSIRFTKAFTKVMPLINLKNGVKRS